MAGPDSTTSMTSGILWMTEVSHALQAGRPYVCSEELCDMIQEALRRAERVLTCLTARTTFHVIHDDAVCG